MRRFIVFVGLIVTLFTFLGCSKKVKETYLDADTLYITLPQEPATLNPVPAVDLYSSYVISFIFDSLLEVDTNLNFLPKIVEKYEVSEDGKSFVFHLRKDVYWHDGYPLTAEDIIYTFSMITNPSSQALNKASLYKDVEKVELIDEYTFKVTYKQPYAPALESWSLTPIPKHIYEKEKSFLESPYNRNPIGCGPYKLKEWIPGQYIKLVRVENYWDKDNLPKFKQIVIRIVKDPDVAIKLFLKGQLDIVGLRPVHYLKYENDKSFVERFSIYKYYTMGFSQIALNLTKPLFQDRRVRVALSYALNREKILKEIYYGLAIPISGPFYYYSWAYNKNIKPYEYDLQKAKELLKEAGWEDIDGDGILEKDGKKFIFELLLSSGSVEGRRIAEIFKEDLAKIGVIMNIRILDWSTVSRRISEKSFEAVMFGWSLSIDPDPYDLWHSSQITNGLNFVSYSNPEVDKLCEEGRKIFDKKVRAEIYHKVHEILHEDQPYIFLFTPASLVATVKNLRNVYPSPLGIMFYYPGYRIWYKEVPSDGNQ